MSTAENTEAAMSSEQAADFARLQADAAPAPAPAPTGQGGEAQASEQAQPSEASIRMAAVLLGMLRPVLCVALPALRSANDELWEPLPLGVAGVLDHYNATGAKWLQGPWMGLALCAAPLVGHCAMVELSKPKAPKALASPQAGDTLAAPAPADAPGQKTVTIGAVQAISGGAA